jgi:carboxyl-terminal processing protease
MKRLCSLLLFFLYATSPFLLLSPSFVYAGESKQEQDIYRQLETFANVLTLMQQYYVDAIDPNKVITGAMIGMLDTLDPHSIYMRPDELKEMEELSSGSFIGIGLEVTVRDGVLTAVSSVEGTPAQRQGIESGDQIIGINGESTKDMSLLEATKKLRGKKGSSVTLSIHRQGATELKYLTMLREAIPLISVRYSEMEPGFAYIRISLFQANTTKDVRNALKNLRKKHAVQGLILDLRNNPGGLFDQATKIADLFLDKGVIVSTKGRKKEEQIVVEARPGNKYTNFPMVLLVNSGSASSSEILAGALQDHKRALILGTTTFGKGSVQSVLPLPDGAGLRLTTAKYYTPSGASIQATGIKPDMVVPLITPGESATAQSSQSIREKDLPRHLRNEQQNDKVGRYSTEKQADKQEESEAQEEHLAQMEDIRQISKRLEQDNQLRTALTTLKNMGHAQGAAH